MDNWDWDTIHHNHIVGLGFGACSHCGVAQPFDASRFFDFRFYCLKPECNVAGHAYWHACEQKRRKCLEEERRSLQRWKEQDEARRKRQKEEDDLLEGRAIAFPTIACTKCRQTTDHVLLHNNELLCRACAGRK